MPISTDDKTRIDMVLATAQARLMADTSKPFSGPAIEGAQLLGDAERLVNGIVNIDPVAFVAYVQQIQQIWAEYIKASSAFGMGPFTMGFEALSYSGG